MCICIALLRIHPLCACSMHSLYPLVVFARFCALALHARSMHSLYKHTHTLSLRSCCCYMHCTIVHSSFVIKQQAIAPSMQNFQSKSQSPSRSVPGSHSCHSSLLPSLTVSPLLQCRKGGHGLHGKVRQGTQGKARQGEVRQGKVRQGNAR